MMQHNHEPHHIAQSLNKQTHENTYEDREPQHRQDKTIKTQNIQTLKHMFKPIKTQQNRDTSHNKKILEPSAMK